MNITPDFDRKRSGSFATSSDGEADLPNHLDAAKNPNHSIGLKPAIRSKKNPKTHPHRGSIGVVTFGGIEQIDESTQGDSGMLPSAFNGLAADADVPATGENRQINQSGKDATQVFSDDEIEQDLADIDANGADIDLHASATQNVLSKAPEQEIPAVARNSPKIAGITSVRPVPLVLQEEFSKRPTQMAA